MKTKTHSQHSFPEYWNELLVKLNQIIPLKVKETIKTNLFHNTSLYFHDLLYLIFLISNLVSLYMLCYICYHAPFILHAYFCIFYYCALL